MHRRPYPVGDPVCFAAPIRATAPVPGSGCRCGCTPWPAPSERYDEWASDQFDRLHPGPQESWIDEHGKMHERPRPENPFKVKASAT